MLSEFLEKIKFIILTFLEPCLKIHDHMLLCASVCCSELVKIWLPEALIQASSWETVSLVHAQQLMGT